MNNNDLWSREQPTLNLIWNLLTRCSEQSVNLPLRIANLQEYHLMQRLIARRVYCAIILINFWSQWNTGFKGCNHSTLQVWIMWVTKMSFLTILVNRNQSIMNCSNVSSRYRMAKVIVHSSPESGCIFGGYSNIHKTLRGHVRHILQFLATKLSLIRTCSLKRCD